MKECNILEVCEQETCKVLESAWRHQELFRIKSMHCTVFQNCLPEVVRFFETSVTFPPLGRTVLRIARNGFQLYFHLRLVWQKAITDRSRPGIRTVGNHCTFVLHSKEHCYQPRCGDWNHIHTSWAGTEWNS